MTREEAIRELTNLKEEFESAEYEDYEHATLVDIKEPLKPSAKTHEIRTETHECVKGTHDTDLISRADAIEAVVSWTVEDRPHEVMPTDLVDRIKALPSADAVPQSEQYKKGFEDCKRAYEIELARSADAVQGWIPVEEQPPVFPCLVCDANGNQPSVPLGIVTITDEEHGEWHIDGRLWDTKIFFKGEWCSQTGYGNRIIAWMPLPTPYKGGDEE